MEIARIVRCCVIHLELICYCCLYAAHRSNKLANTSFSLIPWLKCFLWEIALEMFTLNWILSNILHFSAIICLMNGRARLCIYMFRSLNVWKLNLHELLYFSFSNVCALVFHFTFATISTPSNQKCCKWKAHIKTKMTHARRAYRRVSHASKRR